MLETLGFEGPALDAVPAYRYLRLSPTAVVDAEPDGRYAVSASDLTVIDGDLVVTVRRPDGIVAHLSGGPQPSLADPVRAWVTEVLDRQPAFPWARGGRVARCYLDRLSAPRPVDPHERYPEPVSLIIEQGDLQLWCSAYFPLDCTSYLSEEAYSVLDAVDLFPADLAQAEARTWFQRLLARQQRRPAFIDVSSGGDEALRRPPPAWTMTLAASGQGDPAIERERTRRSSLRIAPVGDDAP